MPYWDWARGESGETVPSFFTTPTIDITRPNGAKDTIPNPLYSYTFHPLMTSDFDGKVRLNPHCLSLPTHPFPQWRNFNTTLRWPTSSTLTAVSDQTPFLKSYDSQRRNLHDTIDAAFRRSTLNAFASTLEDTHGWVHGIIGGGWDAKSEPGHMWPLDYSAYEPLFMAHHTYFLPNPTSLLAIANVEK
jgi:tyrosinase